jgi:hypothetical protein
MSIFNIEIPSWKNEDPGSKGGGIIAVVKNMFRLIYPCLNIQLAIGYRFAGRFKMLTDPQYAAPFHMQPVRPSASYDLSLEVIWINEMACSEAPCPEGRGFREAFR